MIFILGERPGPNTDPDRPLYPHTDTGAAARLMRLLNFNNKEDYLAVTTRLNAVERGSASSASLESRSRVASFLAKAGSKPFIVLGKSAIKAMPAKYRKMSFGEILDNVLLIPHTSGVNRYWNNSETTAKMQKVAREHIKNGLSSPDNG